MKILWVKNNLLHPLDSGGKIRSYSMLARLQRHNDVHYVAFADPDRDAAPMKLAHEYCGELFFVPHRREAKKHTIGYYGRVIGSLRSPIPFTILSYHDREMERLIRELLERNCYDVIVVDFLSMCLNVPSSSRAPLVHFSHNVESMIWERHVRNERNPIRRMIFARERDRMRLFERRIVNSYAFTIAVSREDRDYFARTFGAARVDYVETGIDSDYYAPGSDRDTGDTILFLGSMDWMPNIDAVHYFIKHMWPRIKREVPEAQLLVVGRNPVASVARLGAKKTDIVVTGTVPDTRPYIDRSACAVVPLRIGGGTRLKIYEIMAMGKPVVSTTIGAEGLQYVDGENIAIADDPDRFSEHVIRILRDRNARAIMGRNARTHVVEHCSWDRAADRFVGILQRAKEASRS